MNVKTKYNKIHEISTFSLQNPPNAPPLHPRCTPKSEAKPKESDETSIGSNF